MALSKGPEDKPSAPEDYFAQYLKEPSADDAKFSSALQQLLKKLYARQREEFYRRIEEQGSEMSPFGSEAQHAIPPKIWNEHRAWDKQQNERFYQERNRYIQDYQKAQALRDEMQKSEKKDLHLGLDDIPKRSL